MALNFTGRLPPPEAAPPRGRMPAVALACFGAAAVLAALVFAVALRQHRVDAPSPTPPLVGTDRPQVAAASPPRAVGPAPAEPWIMHKAAVQPASRNRSASFCA